MNDRVIVRGLRALGRHGANPGEQDHPQPFDIDVAAMVDFAHAATLDRLEHTIDYRTLVAEVRRVVAEESFQLIEALAQAIADRVIALGADAVNVRVAKPAAASSLGVGEVAVEVQRHSPPRHPKR